VHVVVTPDTINNEPFLVDLGPLSTPINTPIEFDLSAIDLEGDPIYYFVENLAQNNFDVSVDRLTGRVRAVPPTDFTGNMEFEVRASSRESISNFGAFDVQRVSVAVGAATALHVDLEAASDSGAMNDDNITNQSVLSFLVSGVGATDAPVLEIDALQVPMTVERLAPGQARLTVALPSPISDGIHRFTVRVEQQGQTTVSGSLDVTLDRQSPGLDIATPPTVIDLGVPFAFDLQHPEEGGAGLEFFIVDTSGIVQIDQLTGAMLFTSDVVGQISYQLQLVDIAGNLAVLDLPLLIVDGTIDVSAPDLVQFAQDLAAAGVTLYGAPWDANTTMQRSMFEDGGRLLPFVDVTTANRTPNAIGNTMQITTYPTWVLSDGTRLEGMRTLAELRAATGIAIQTTDSPWLAELDDVTVFQRSPLHIPLDGFDGDGTGITYTVASGSNQIATRLLSSNRHLRISVEGYGDLVFELFDDRVPGLTSHLTGLAQSGFYDGRLFYRVNSSLIQTGDVEDVGMGTADHGAVDDEFHQELQHNRSGVLSLAKLVDDGNGTHFFITSGPRREYDFHHAIVGQLVEGEDVRQAIESVAKTVGGAPKYPIRISSAEVFDNREDAVLLVSANEISASGTITVTATNVGGASFQRQFRVTVTADPFDSSPFLLPMTNIVSLVGQAISIQLAAFDREGDEIRYEVQPSEGADYSVNHDRTSGRVTVVPRAGFIGRLEFRVLVYSPDSDRQMDYYDHETIVIDVVSGEGG
jgi:cyclophilin family peptidyl-prolyl cis-trans isomerase